MPELLINHAIVCNIIQLAKNFHSKEQVVIPEKGEDLSGDSDALQFLADHANDPTFTEFTQLVNNLNTEEQANLVALMYLGRGDYSLEEWSDALAEARYGWTHHTAAYLISKPLLADYLEDGLNMFGYMCDE